ncbi:hypothetical protein NBRC10512_000719 [Rhodotorula toruloides]|uniref:Protein yippee-like n=1 Tax=Rhodotorula toruloides (strain NP11) TaxID=1130832 RepID=M7WXL4_RHOT1|nr:Yippee-like protein [Rhodotorula toruloides NP11]EMS22605.1 Yippee-like protein [Rhodotorula toruloides NP11]
MPADHNHSDAHTFLPPHVPAYACGTCSLEVALQDELVSRSFQGTSGPAYLFRTAVNVDIGTKTSKQLLSGKHVISPIHCSGCSTELGWKYIRSGQFVSPDSSQKYKEGKCILEKSKIYKDNKWSLDD